MATWVFPIGAPELRSDHIIHGTYLSVVAVSRRVPLLAAEGRGRESLILKRFLHQCSLLCPLARNQQYGTMSWPLFVLVYVLWALIPVIELMALMCYYEAADIYAHFVRFAKLMHAR